MNSVTQSSQSFDNVIRDMADRAHEALNPASVQLIPKALDLALNNHVEVTGPNTAIVLSSDRTTVYHVNGSCTCPHAQQAHAGLCKHRLAFWLVKRAQDEMALACEVKAASTHERRDEQPIRATCFRPEDIVEIHGKPFVRYAGLLRLAHEKGLVDLRVVWTYNDDTLSLAQATARFDEGIFTECGDASPSNVSEQCAKHFRRIALTRAKARALRDALGIDMVAVEEME